jgi:probable F420-dependent oxidoreductase
LPEFGATFPQTEIGADPTAIREWAVGVEAMGFDYVLAYDHVLGARAGHPSLGGRRTPYTSASMFHEPMVLFGYLAAITRRVELVTGILILPQRQTALVAKQSAAIDVLSGGRMKLGVGLGWNPVEYEALGQDFHNRGRRVEEQVDVLRLLWTQDIITFRGRWHTITEAGINPLPVQRPIPILFGGTDDRAIERIGRIGDGWISMGKPDGANERRVQLLRESARRAGRDPAALQLFGSLSARADNSDAQVLEEAAGWRGLRATHITLNTMNGGCQTVADHLTALHRAQETIASLDGA